MAITLDTPPRGLRVPARPLWSSRLVFVLAAAGSAVGLGNVWKFPYITGRHGGGAFVLVYLGCVALIGLPVLMAELALGRRGGRNPVDSMRRLARAEGAARLWQGLGWAGVVNAFVILSFYSVVAGWAIAYFGEALAGRLLVPGDPTRVAQRFAALLASPVTLIACHTIFLAITARVVASGLARGLERAVRWMMPLLLALLGALVVHAAATSGQFAPTLAWLFRPDFGALTWGAVTEAMGHAFFTLSVGMGGMLVYGSHLSRRESIPRAAATVVGIDTLVALLAGLAIFPVVFAHGLEPAEGPGLIFVTLPVALDGVPGGALLAVLFFGFLGLAALTSAIAILEIAVSVLTERFGVSRPGATWGAAASVWLLGLISVFAFNAWSGVSLFGAGLFDFLNFATSSVLLPVTGLGFSVFAGWVLCRDSAREELGLPEPLFRAWRVLVRWVAPLAIGVVLLRGVLG